MLLLARHVAVSQRTSTGRLFVAHSLTAAGAQRQSMFSQATLRVQETSPRALLLPQSVKFSTSAIRRSEVPHSYDKVEALPFKLDPWNARMRSKVYAISKSKGSLLGTFLLYPLSSALKYMFGLPELSNYLEAPARVERFEAIYLPYWIIDTNFTIQTKGTGVDKKAEASLVSVNSRMPGFNWQPMRSLPLAPPSADEVAYEVFEDAHLDGPGRAQAELGKDSVDWDEPAGSEGLNNLPKRATLLPYSISPLSLPAVLQDADAAPLEIKLPRIVAVSEEEIKSGEMFEPPKPDRIRFMSETLDFDLLACYPVLLPAYVTRFKPVVDENGERMEPLVVVQGAWHDFKVVDSPIFATGGSVLKHPLEEIMPHKPSWTMQDWTPMVALSAPFFDPAVPLPDPEAPEIATRKNRKRAGKAKAHEAVGAMSAFGLGGAEMGQMTEGIGHALLQAQLIAVAQKWIEQGDWSALEVKERTAAEQRTKLDGKVPEDERKNLGNVDWQDVRVQRFSEQSEENREYLEAVDALLDVRRTNKTLKATAAKIARKGGPEDSIDEREDEALGEAEEIKAKARPDWLQTWRCQREAESVKTNKEETS